MQVLIFGAGFSGRAIGAEFARREIKVVGTTRSADKLDDLARHGIQPLLFDGSTISEELAEAIAKSSHLIVSAAPDQAGDPVLRSVGHLLEEQARAKKLRWIGYLSTIGVYGDQQGAWVDEEGALAATSTRGRQRIEAEQEWLDFGARHDLPVALLRLAGIYGPGRNVLKNLEEGKARRIIKQGQVFNRIHVDDIAAASWLLAKGEIGGAFNVTDNEPAPPQDIMLYGAKLLGIEAPPEVAFETAEMSPMARSFYSDNKRVSNEKLKKQGHVPLYPDYRTALDEMYRKRNWRG